MGMKRAATVPFTKAETSDSLSNGQTNRTRLFDEHAVPAIPSRRIETIFHGNCAKCHHWHNCVPLTIALDSITRTRVNCKNCLAYMCAIGGNDSVLSLLSRETIPVRTLKQDDDIYMLPGLGHPEEGILALSRDPRNDQTEIGNLRYVPRNFGISSETSLPPISMGLHEMPTQVHVPNMTIVPDANIAVEGTAVLQSQSMTSKPTSVKNETSPSKHPRAKLKRPRNMPQRLAQRLKIKQLLRKVINRCGWDLKVDLVRLKSRDKSMLDAKTSFDDHGAENAQVESRDKNHAPIDKGRPSFGVEGLSRAPTLNSGDSDPGPNPRVSDQSPVTHINPRSHNRASLVRFIRRRKTQEAQANTCACSAPCHCTNGYQDSNIAVDGCESQQLCESPKQIEYRHPDGSHESLPTLSDHQEHILSSVGSGFQNVLERRHDSVLGENVVVSVPRTYPAQITDISSLVDASPSSSSPSSSSPRHHSGESDSR